MLSQFPILVDFRDLKYKDAWLDKAIPLMID